MNTDVEELLRDGMERFTAGVQAPDGLARTAGGLHRRRMSVQATAAFGGIAVAAAAVVIVGAAASGPRATPNPAQQRHIAYVTSRVENALANENLVYVGQSEGSHGDRYTTWAYGPEQRSVEWQSPGHPFLVQGTAIVGGKLMSTYVTYFDKRYSLQGPSSGSEPASACSSDEELTLGSPFIVSSGWSAFLDATLRCGAASVTGNVRINGVETTQITGKPVTVRLSPGYSKAVNEAYATVSWMMYVDPRSYLPVRIIGSTQTHGGTAGNQISPMVTNVQWLPATPANVAQALVTIPPGFHLFKGLPGNQ